MEEIVSNDSVNGLFSQITIEGKLKLVCDACTEYNRKYANLNIFIGIYLEDPDYRQCQDNQPRWFLNFKSNLISHLDTMNHDNAAQEFIRNSNTQRNSKDRVHENMRHILYFSLKSSLSFNEYPKLLATVNRCKAEIGHINHSRPFITKYCDYVGEEMKQDTVIWAKKQSIFNVTLDIGTCTGITLLAILIISGDQVVRLVDIVPVTSKKGVYLANVLYETLQMKNKDSVSQITENELKEKLSAILGDGAFVKDNRPFKETLNSLVGKELTYRWDPLHLANRAHIEARGKIYKNEIDPDNAGWDLEISENDTGQSEDTNLLRNLIKFIQKQSKEYRTGIKYTNLRELTHGSFKRPKVWSSTRMCLYEWDMLDRFLENSSFFQVCNIFNSYYYNFTVVCNTVHTAIHLIQKFYHSEIEI